MWAVFKKELKSYFLSPIGYVVIGILLLVCSVFFYLTTIQYSSIDLGGLYFYVALYGLIITVPILTMRMFSEERKNGTEQLVLTSPRSITSVVLGKFLAAAVVILITEAFTLMYYFILKYFGNPSLKVALSTLFGFFLLSLAYISFGMFASSLTENQIIASVLTIGTFIVMWFLPNFSTNLEMFSLIQIFDKFPQGIISISEIVTFVSFSVLFILLTIVVLQRRKSVK